MTRGLLERTHWVIEQLGKFTTRRVPYSVLAAHARLIVSEAFIAIEEDDIEWHRVIKVALAGYTLREAQRIIESGE